MGVLVVIYEYMRQGVCICLVLTDATHEMNWFLNNLGVVWEKLVEELGAAVVPA